MIAVIPKLRTVPVGTALLIFAACTDGNGDSAAADAAGAHDAAGTEMHADEAAAHGPIDLRFASSDEPATYLASYEQDIDWGGAEVARRFGARYTVTAVGPGDGSLPATVRLDSLGVGVSSPHGRNVFDTRHLAGTEFEVRIPERGGIPVYQDEPVFDMGAALERQVHLSRLVNYAFPELPDHPVEVGDSWTTQTSRQQVEAYLSMPADLTTEYRFAGWEVVEGVRCAKIEGNLASQMTAHAQLGDGQDVSYTGTLEGQATWLFDPGSGTLVRMTAEESSDGLLTQGEKDTPIRQHTQVQIGLER